MKICFNCKWYKQKCIKGKKPKNIYKDRCGEFTEELLDW